MKILSTTDFTKTEAQNIVIHKASSAPTSPVAGQLYFNTSTKKLYFYDGTTWVELPGSGGGGTASFIWAPNGFPPKPPGYDEYVVPYALSGTAGTTLALTASRIYWIPFFVWRTVTITTMAINVTTASSGTHTVGIYSANTSLQPGSLLYSASFDAGSTGVKTATPNLQLTQGVYWIGWHAGSGATVRAIALAASMSLALPGLGTANANYWYTSGTSLPNPAPTSGYTAATGGAVPAVGMKYTFV